EDLAGDYGLAGLDSLQPRLIARYLSKIGPDDPRRAQTLGDAIETYAWRDSTDQTVLTRVAPWAAELDAMAPKALEQRISLHRTLAAYRKARQPADYQASAAETRIVMSLLPAKVDGKANPELISLYADLLADYTELGQSDSVHRIYERAMAELKDVHDERG